MKKREKGKYRKEENLKENNREEKRKKVETIQKGRNRRNILGKKDKENGKYKGRKSEGK